jgi:hypothetical protein
MARAPLDASKMFHMRSVLSISLATSLNSHMSMSGQAPILLRVSATTVQLVLTLFP